MTDPSSFDAHRSRQSHEQAAVSQFDSTAPLPQFGSASQVGPAESAPLLGVSQIAGWPALPPFGTIPSSQLSWPTTNGGVSEQMSVSQMAVSQMAGQMAVSQMLGQMSVSQMSGQMSSPMLGQMSVSQMSGQMSSPMLGQMSVSQMSVSQMSVSQVSRAGIGLNDTPQQFSAIPPSWHVSGPLANVSQHGAAAAVRQVGSRLEQQDPIEQRPLRVIHVGECMVRAGIEQWRRK